MLEPALDPTPESVRISVETGGDTIAFAYAEQQDATHEASGSVDDAAQRFEADSAIVVRGAAQPRALRVAGRGLLGPMVANPRMRASLDMFGWERDLGLARYELLGTILGSSAMRVLRRVFKSDRLLLFEHNFHRPRILQPDAPSAGLPLHQDGGFLGIPMVRGWFLLSPESCEAVAPGIELWIGAPDRILPVETAPESKDYGWLEMSHAERDAIVASCTRWRPALRIGDALLFRGTVPHRTHIPTGATLPRLSLETTIFPAREDLIEFCLRNDPLGGAFIAGDDGFDHVRRIGLPHRRAP